MCVLQSTMYLFKARPICVPHFAQVHKQLRKVNLCMIYACGSAIRACWRRLLQKRPEGLQEDASHEDVLRNMISACDLSTAIALSYPAQRRAEGAAQSVGQVEMLREDARSAAYRAHRTLDSALGGNAAELTKLMNKTRECVTELYGLLVGGFDSTDLARTCVENGYALTFTLLLDEDETKDLFEHMRDESIAARVEGRSTFRPWNNTTLLCTTDGPELCRIRGGVAGIYPHVVTIGKYVADTDTWWIKNSYGPTPGLLGWLALSTPVMRKIVGRAQLFGGGVCKSPYNIIFHTSEIQTLSEFLVIEDLDGMTVEDLVREYPQETSGRLE